MRLTQHPHQLPGRTGCVQHKRVRKKRLEAGLTQKELAGRLFVTESSVSKWERNLSYPGGKADRHSQPPPV